MGFLGLRPRKYMCSPRAVHIPYTVETMIQLLLVPYISGNSKAPRVGTLPMFCIEKPFMLVLHKEILELRGACKTESL